MKWLPVTKEVIRTHTVRVSDQAFWSVIWIQVNGVIVDKLHYSDPRLRRTAIQYANRQAEVLKNALLTAGLSVSVSKIEAN